MPDVNMDIYSKLSTRDGFNNEVKMLFDQLIESKEFKDKIKKIINEE